MSSTRIGPRGTLTPEVGRWSPVPLHWISKKTIRVVVFHRRRSSHLFYTPYVFSQCQTRVKLNPTLVWLGRNQPSQTRGVEPLAQPASLYLDRGSSQCLQPRRRSTRRSALAGMGSPGQQVPRVPRLDHLTTRRPLGALSFPRMVPMNPIETWFLGSSFPADSAKPVPLAVVSLDSR